MAQITDPDFLHDGATDNGSTEVFIDTSAKTIKLNIVGNLSTDGVTIKCLYSFLKEQWRSDPNAKNLAAFPFPMVPITDESFEFVDGWNFIADASRYLIRTGGWTVRNTSGNVIEKWAGIIGLGTVPGSAQLYYNQGIGATNVQLLGQINQAVEVLRDDNGNGTYTDGYDFDRRATFKIFCREQGQQYGSAALSDIGVTAMDSIEYRFPLGVGTDSKISHSDVYIGANTPYTGMTITFYATPQVRSIGGVNKNFGIVINGNNGTAEQIYEFVQKALRQATDIDAGAGTVIGKTADAMLQFVGDTLKTLAATNPSGGGTGVFIDNYQTVDVNRLVFTDNTGAQLTFPYIASLTISF